MNLRSRNDRLDGGVLVSLPQDAPFALLHVGRPPRCIEMVKRNQPFLAIRARAHLSRAAEPNASLACANVTEKRQISSIRIVIRDEDDVCSWHTKLTKF